MLGILLIGSICVIDFLTKTLIISHPLIETMPKKYIQICPKCKSTDISKDFSAQAYGRGTFFNQYKCNNCGYSGQFFPEISEKELKKTK